MIYIIPRLCITIGKGGREREGEALALTFISDPDYNGTAFMF